MARTILSLAAACALLASGTTSANAAEGALATPSFSATPQPTDMCSEDYSCEYCPPNMEGFCFNFQPLCRSGKDPRGMYRARIIFAGVDVCRPPASTATATARTRRHGGAAARRRR